MANTETMLKEIEAVVSKHGASMKVDHLDATKMTIKIAVAQEDAAPAPAGLARQERDRIALSKLNDADKAILDDPTVLALARAENKSPAEFLVSLREKEDDLAIKAFKAGREPGAQRVAPKQYGRRLSAD